VKLLTQLHRDSTRHGDISIDEPAEQPLLEVHREALRLWDPELDGRDHHGDPRERRRRDCVAATEDRWHVEVKDGRVKRTELTGQLAQQARCSPARRPTDLADRKPLCVRLVAHPRELGLLVTSDRAFVPAPPESFHELQQASFRSSECVAVDVVENARRHLAYALLKGRDALELPLERAIPPLRHG
jgi:hypothetical protein